MFDNFYPESRAIYEVMWKNVKPDIDDDIKRRMRFAFWITKARYTQSEYVIYLLFHGDCALMLRYMYIAFFV
jgi:hypothetical protein